MTTNTARIDWYCLNSNINVVTDYALLGSRIYNCCKAQAIKFALAVAVKVVVVYLRLDLSNELYCSGKNAFPNVPQI